MDEPIYDICVVFMWTGHIFHQVMHPSLALDSLSDKRYLKKKNDIIKPLYVESFWGTHKYVFEFDIPRRHWNVAGYWDSLSRKTSMVPLSVAADELATGARASAGMILTQFFHTSRVKCGNYICDEIFISLLCYMPLDSTLAELFGKFQNRKKSLYLNSLLLRLWKIWCYHIKTFFLLSESRGLGIFNVDQGLFH